MDFSKKWLRNHQKFLLHFLIHIDVLMLCSKFEVIPTSIFRVMAILMNGKMANLSRKCCRCSRRGRCVSCACVKAKRSCYNCKPLKDDHCINSLSIPDTPEKIPAVDNSIHTLQNDRHL